MSKIIQYLTQNPTLIPLFLNEKICFVGIKNDLAIIISGFSRLILFSVEGLWFLWANISHKRIGTKK